MRLIFSPEKINGIRLTNIMSTLKYCENIGSRVVNSIISDNEFTSRLFNVLGVLHPNLDLVANSFIQESVIKSLTGVEVYVYTSDFADKYYTGNVYLPLYKRLKKSGVKNLYLDEKISTNKDVTEDELITEIMIIWKETHMGEITDAISKAIKDMSLGHEEPREDRIKQAMADIGMPVENYTKKETPAADDYTEEQTPTIAEEASEVNAENEQDVNEEPAQQDIGEVCLKISGNTMVIMIPKGVELPVIKSAGGIEFSTITTRVPDVNSDKLQILQVLTPAQSEPDEEIVEEIVRVPIFLETETQDSPTEDAESHISESYEDNELKQRKEELDLAIKKARKDGDTELLAELRKQRRKVRSQLNKLGV